MKVTWSLKVFVKFLEWTDLEKFGKPKNNLGMHDWKANSVREILELWLVPLICRSCMAAALYTAG